MSLKEGKSRKIDQNCVGLAVFTFLFAWSYLFDIREAIAYLPNISEYPTTRLLSLVIAILAIWTILKPSSLIRSISFFVALLILTFIRMPNVANHEFWECIILITILSCFVYSKISEKSNFTNTTFYELFAPALRLELIILYFWTIVHKLNTGFLDYKISCATVEIFQIKNIIPALPTPYWFIPINPLFTLLIEASIPILLIIPKTRILGLILGIVFHFILGLIYMGFTILIFSLFSLFIPTSSYDKIKTIVYELIDKFSDPFTRIINYKSWKRSKIVNYIVQFIFILSILFILRIFMKGSYKSSLFLSKNGLYVIFCIILSITFLYFVVRRTKELRVNQKINFIPSNRWLLIFPALVLLNGLLPHIGLKNIQVMAMFSNLRTEGGKTNHLFIPPSFQLFNNLNDLVLIKGSNDRILNQFSKYNSGRSFEFTTIEFPKYYIQYLKRNNEHFKTTFKYLIPFVSLQNQITEMAEDGAKNIALLYERDGKNFYTRNAELDPHLSNASLFQMKFLAQRAVPLDERGLCMW